MLPLFYRRKIDLELNQMGITTKLLKIAVIASMTAKTDLEFDETIVKKHLTLSAVNFKERGPRFIKSSLGLDSGLGIFRFLES